MMRGINELYVIAEQKVSMRKGLVRHELHGHSTVIHLLHEFFHVFRSNKAIQFTVESVEWVSYLT